MQILLDTHALLWLISGSDRLSANARQAYLETTNQLFLSVASLWEMAVKISLGKLELKTDWPRRIDREMDANGIRGLAIRPEHCVAVASLPFHHRDPFDRLLIAQAMAEGLSILTADRRFGAYGVPILW